MSAGHWFVVVVALLWVLYLLWGCVSAWRHHRERAAFREEHRERAAFREEQRRMYLYSSAAHYDGRLGIDAYQAEQMIQYLEALKRDDATEKDQCPPSQ